MTANHRTRADHALSDLEDVRLLDYIATAKRAGATEDAVRGVHFLLYRHETRMRARVALRLPKHLAHHAETVGEWVLERVTKSALRLQLEGDSVGEWVNWWGTAIDRQVISFWRSAQGKELERETRLSSEHEGEDGAGPDRLGEDFDVDRVLARSWYAEITSKVLAGLANQQHQAIVEARVWEDRTSADVAEQFDTSANNVDAITSRFRKDLRAECERQGVAES